MAGIDHRKNELVVKLVNGRTEPWQTSLVVKGGTIRSSEAHCIELTSASIRDENSFDEPDKIVPRESALHIAGHTIPLECAPQSLTILRIPLN